MWSINQARCQQIPLPILGTIPFFHEEEKLSIIIITIHWRIDNNSNHDAWLLYNWARNIEINNVNAAGLPIKYKAPFHVNNMPDAYCNANNKCYRARINVLCVWIEPIRDRRSLASIAIYFSENNLRSRVLKGNNYSLLNECKFCRTITFNYII